MLSAYKTYAAWIFILTDDVFLENSNFFLGQKKNIILGFWCLKLISKGNNLTEKYEATKVKAVALTI